MLLKWLIRFAPDDGKTVPNNEPVVEPPSEEKEEEDQEQFDEERARNTIKAQRESEKLAKRRASELQKQLEDANKKIQEHDDAGKTELQRLQDQAARLEKELADTKNADGKSIEIGRSKIVRSELRAVLSELKVTARPETVLRLLDSSEIEFDTTDDDRIGEPKNLKKLVEKLVKDEPILIGSQQQDTIPGNRSNTVPSTDTTDTSKHRVNATYANRF